MERLCNLREISSTSLGTKQILHWVVLYLHQNSSTEQQQRIIFDHKKRRSMESSHDCIRHFFFAVFCLLRGHFGCIVRAGDDISTFQRACLTA